METKKIFVQMVDFQKIFFENSCNLMDICNNHCEQIMHMSIDQNTWIPEDGKKICSHWIEIYQKNMNNYKEFMDTNFNKVRELFASEKTASEEPL